MAMDRRQFLRMTAAGAVTGLSLPAAAAAAVTGLSGPGGASMARALAYPSLLTVLGPERVRAIGGWWRETTPNERGAESIAAAIIGTAPPKGGARADAGRETPTLVRRDFADERTVFVDGWLLSITEVRQCALFSLLAG
jgi:hypothetical protein